MKLTTKLKISAGALAIAAVSVTSAQAYTETFTMSVAFANPFSFTEAVAADFATLINVNTTYELAPDSTLTPGAGGGQVTGTAAAGTYTVIDSAAGGTVDITVDNQQAGVNGFVTIDEFNCDYGGGAAVGGVSCSFPGAANPGAGTALRVGFDITVANDPADADTDTADFDVTVGYS
ncbi:MAG: hypothetical protein MK052_07330 [Alphaproteobacteria bacterium]|nr:hypothetical protein [Alphaproteobacteria bacterium]